MPTKKPRIQTILEIQTYEKFKIICETKMRTESQLSGYIITKYIKEYEQLHEEIKTNITPNV